MKGREQPRDTSLGTVHFWTKDGKLPAILRNLIDERVPRTVHAHTGQASGPLLDDDGTDVLQAMRPTVAAVFYATTSQDSSHVQRNARRVGAQMAAGLPQASLWLQGQIYSLVKRHEDVAVVMRGGAW